MSARMPTEPNPSPSPISSPTEPRRIAGRPGSTWLGAGVGLEIGLEIGLGLGLGLRLGLWLG